MAQKSVKKYPFSVSSIQLLPILFLIKLYLRWEEIEFYSTINQYIFSDFQNRMIWKIKHMCIIFPILIYSQRLMQVSTKSIIDL